MKSIFLSLIVFMFISCGSADPLKEDMPKSPILKDKSKTPPEIPKI